MSAAIQSLEQERDDPRKTTAPPPRDSHEQRTSKEAPGWFGVIFGSDSSGPAGLKTAVTAICIMFSLFHLYTAGFGALTAMLQRNIHLTFAIVLIFLIYPFSKKMPKDSPGVIDLVLSLLGFACGLYVTIFFEEITIRINALAFTRWDYLVGGTAILLVLETSRRTIGWALTSLALVFLAYAYAGPYMPGLLNHRGYSINKIISHVYLTTEGVFGTPLAVSATFVMVFVIFGAFLEVSGAGTFFINLASALTGRSPGGPAKAAVVSSGLMGTMSGSAIANVVTTGVFTIPLMKKTGYPPHKAGAIESVASTGGMIMPPVLGAVAFIMAEYTGISYINICLSAAIPAFLYYLALFWNVHLEALKLGLRGVGEGEVPKLGQTLKEGAHLLIPIIVLVELMIEGYSPMKAAFYGILVMVSVVVIRGWKQMTPRVVSSLLARSLASAGRGILSIAAACACAGIVVGVITLTGIGLKFSVIMVEFSSGIPFLMLILMAVTCLILGMGLPPSASYIITAALGAPALINVGYPVLGVNMLIFYYANLSNITPPVAMAAYTAAGIAEAEPMKTGWYACKIGIVAFMVPFMFVYWPELLMQGSALEILSTTASAIVGILSLTCGVQRQLLIPCKPVETGLLIMGGLLLMKKGFVTDSIGIGIFVLVLARQYFVRRRMQMARDSRVTAGA